MYRLVRAGKYSRSPKFKSQLRDIRVADSFKHLLSDSSLKAVVIATPAAYNYQMDKEALLSKKHVFIEKHLALKYVLINSLKTLWLN